VSKLGSESRTFQWMRLTIAVILENCRFKKKKLNYLRMSKAYSFRAREVKTSKYFFSSGKCELVDLAS